MRKKYGDRVRFLTLYIKEAHPLDEWQMESNEKEERLLPAADDARPSASRSPTTS